MRQVLALTALVLFPVMAAGQGLGMGTGRAHPELRWLERETEHFLLIYPEHLEAFAIEAATVAEQSYRPVLDGMELDDLDFKTSIVLSDEDQIVNGFALPGKMFIWVNVNDYITWEAGTPSWLRGVIAHEFQHDVYFETVRDWSGNLALLRTPGWVVEGLAEYETEPWDAFRSDMHVRRQILRNRHRDLDIHDSGFTMMRYLAETYGDSVIVQSLKYRNRLGLYSFKSGFEKAAGITLGEFEEEWRRAATAWTYSIFGQKEAVDEVGRALEAPLRDIDAIAFSSDSSRMAVLGRSGKADSWALYAVSTDSTRKRRELDHGRIARDFAFSPDGRQVVYAKSHRGNHGSILWDVKIADCESGKSRWLTHSRRASHPHWSPNGERIVFTAIDEMATNLYTCSPDGGKLRQLTENAAETRLLSPRFSPDGKEIACALYRPGDGLNIHVLDIDKGIMRQLTDNPAKDLLPIWSADGSRLFFTATRSEYVPNVFTVAADGDESDVECLSDVGEALGAFDLLPGGRELACLAMGSVDTMRLRAVPTERRVEPVTPAVRDRYISWRDRVPPHPVGEVDLENVPEMSEARPYKAWRHLGIDGWMVSPSFDLKGLWGGGIITDSAHKMRLVVGGDFGQTDDGPALRGLYANLVKLCGPGFLDIAAWQGRAVLRNYDEVLLSDLRYGWRVDWSIPMNAGEHFHANHELRLSLRSESVELDESCRHDSWAPLDEGLAEPVAQYSDGGVRLSYRYTKARRGKRDFGHPRRYTGLQAGYFHANSALTGDFSYRRVNIDATMIRPLPTGSLYGRVRLENLSGEAPAQDFTGLRADLNILPNPPNLPLLDDFLGLPEGFAPRGLAGSLPGNQAMLATLELRLPLLPPLPVKAFGFSPGGVTGVLFADHGRVTAEDGKSETVLFGGWELRVPLRIGKRALLFPSYGQAADISRELKPSLWSGGNYFRLAAVTPF